MSYFPAIPAATDDPSVSQSAIQTNFGTLNTAFALNHVALGSGASQGKHNFTEMPVQTLNPETISGEGTLFTKTVSDHSVNGSQLFYMPDANSTMTPGDVYQMTRTIHANYSTFANQTGSNFSGWTFLPGGLLMQWGTFTGASGSSVSFPVTFSSAVFSIQMTVFQNTTNRHFAYARSVGLASFTTTQLDSGGSAESNTFSWLAIGK